MPQLSHFQLQGYIKDLQMCVDNSVESKFYFANQIHNRMNFSWFNQKGLSARLDLRSRVFTGSLVHEPKGFTKILGFDSGISDLTWSADIGNNTAAVTAAERLWLSFRKKNLEVTAGRQRINWGMNIFWNPNDIFNAYDFFDFDYEERPGCDAVRIQYNTSGFSHLEAVLSSDHERQYTTAFMYRFNFRKYDFQLLGGRMKSTPVAGFGCAGGLGGTGFKGEVTWFNYDKSTIRNKGIVASAGLDRTFDEGWYLVASYLYNGTIPTQYSYPMMQIDPSNPFPYPHAALLQLNRQINAVWSASAGLLASSYKNLMLFPTVSYSPHENWEFLLTVQYSRNENTGVNAANIFLRTRWDFVRE